MNLILLWKNLAVLSFPTNKFVYSSGKSYDNLRLSIIYGSHPLQHCWNYYTPFMHFVASSGNIYASQLVHCTLLDNLYLSTLPSIYSLSGFIAIL